jgi:hypothetical protein
MEADSGGSFNMEADLRANFQYGGRFFLHGGGFFLHGRAKPVNLCRRSSTRGSLHKSI